MRDWDKTERLNGAAWDAVGPAFLGACVALIVPVLAMMACITYPPAPTWKVVIGVAASCLAIGFGGIQLWRWATAIQNVSDWRREMEARHDKRTGA